MTDTRMLSFAPKPYTTMTPSERVTFAREHYGATRVVVRNGEAPDEPVEGVAVTSADYVPAAHLYYSAAPDGGTPRMQPWVELEAEYAVTAAQMGLPL